MDNQTMTKKFLPKAEEIFRTQESNWMLGKTGIPYAEVKQKLLNLIEAQDGMIEFINHKKELAESALQNSIKKLERAGLA